MAYARVKKYFKACLRESMRERGACVSANGSDVYFEAERSLPKCAWNCEK